MGKLVKRGKKWCIQNTRNGVIGRCFKNLKIAKAKLAQAKCNAKRQRTGQKISCPLRA